MKDKRDKHMRRLWMMAMAMLFILLPISSALADEGGVVPTVQAENKITVLAYHHLEPQATGKHLTNSAILPIEEFNRHMKYLADNGYHTLSLDELLEFLAGRYEPPAHSVLITFDDGYESNYQYAFPVLAKYNFQAVIFVIGELADESARTVDTHTGEVVPFLKMCIRDRYKVEPTYQSIGKTIGELEIRKYTGAAIIAIVNRNREKTINPGPEQIIKEGSTLVMLGERGQVKACKKLIQNGVVANG